MDVLNPTFFLFTVTALVVLQPRSTPLLTVHSSWFKDNDLILNIKKTKGMIADFRKGLSAHQGLVYEALQLLFIL